MRDWAASANAVRYRAKSSDPATNSSMPEAPAAGSGGRVSERYSAETHSANCPSVMPFAGSQAALPVSTYWLRPFTHEASYSLVTRAQPSRRSSIVAASRKKYCPTTPQLSDGQVRRLRRSDVTQNLPSSSDASKERVLGSGTSAAVGAFFGAMTPTRTKQARNETRATQRFLNGLNGWIIPAKHTTEASAKTDTTPTFPSNSRALSKICWAKITRHACVGKPLLAPKNPVSVVSRFCVVPIFPMKSRVIGSGGRDRTYDQLINSKPLRTRRLTV
jgi:hypothetical protein